MNHLRRSIRAHNYFLHRHRFSHSLPDRRLDFISKEFEDLQSLNPPAAAPKPQPPLEPDLRGGGGGGPVRGEISHPWPEWTELMERAVRKGYLDLTVFSASKNSNQIRTACLNFARDRFDLIRYLSRRDIHIMVGAGCPSLDRKVVNSGKRLRAHVGIEEGDVCSSCNLRGSCERAYVKAREDEGGRTVDVMRILLTYGLDLSTGLENQACVNKPVKESVRKLIHEIVELSAKEIDSNNSKVTSGRPTSRMERKLSRQQMPKALISVPMKQGDWICPKCNFMNFAKNIKCLRCDGLFQERLDKLREEREHLPLKKGDWICEKCNFLNFAKNTRCLQCQEKPPMRQLNPGEWECISCNYINFRRNMICLKCDWKRPKASNNGDITADSQQDSRGLSRRHSNISFVRNCSDADVHLRAPRKCSADEEGRDFWSSEENATDDSDADNDGGDAWNKFAEFDNFPMIGGKSATARDPLEREKWKEEMSRRSQRSSHESSKEDGNKFRSSIPRGTKLEESSSDEDIAGWFR